MPRSYTSQAMRSAFLADTKSDGKPGLMNGATGDAVCARRPFAETATTSNAHTMERRMMILLFRKANELVHERDAALHCRRCVAGADDGRRRPGDATIPDDLEVGCVRNPFRREEGWPVGDLKMHVWLGRIPRVAEERDDLATLDVIADLHAQRTRLHVGIE